MIYDALGPAGPFAAIAVVSLVAMWFVAMESRRRDR